MKKLFLVMIVAALVSACTTTTVTSRDSLLSTLKIGVLKGTRLAVWQDEVVGTSMTQLDVKYLSYEQLKQGVASGNLDVVIGMPATDHLIAEGYWSSDPLEVREFNFHVRADDPRGLSKYSFFASFERQLKKVGYVSSGEAGIVNGELIKQSQLANKLVPCGEMARCLAQLAAHKLDAVFADVQLMQAHLSQVSGQSPALEVSNFSHKQPFTLMVSQKTLTESEFKQLNKMLR